MSALRLRCGEATLAARIGTTVICGWAGRDAAAVQHHIDELAALGVAPPSATPLFYRVAAALLTCASAIEVVGRNSSGEAEAVLLELPEGRFVTVGSDHTDRALEAHGVALSKQACAKPLAPEAWRFEEVHGHWDALVLSARAQLDGSWVEYQHGTLDALRHPDDLLARHGALPSGSAMFLGTLAVRGAIRWADAFEAQLHDPVLGRTLRCTYAITALPVVA